MRHAPLLTDLPADVLADARRMPGTVRVPPITRPFDVTITVPGSKSITNRALLLAALARGRSVLRHALIDAEDAAVMIQAIKQLGARVTPGAGGSLAIDGVGGTWAPSAQDTVLNLANAGTATRFLTAAAVLAPAGYTVTMDGSARMRERPIGELVEMINHLGARAEYPEQHGFPPVRVHGGLVPLHERSLSVGATASSQFVSAVLLLGAFVEGGVRVRFIAPPTSYAYVHMTLGLLEQVGAIVTNERATSAHVRPPQDGLTGFELNIEPDVSSAGYWLAAATMCPKSVARVPGPWDRSLQGDVRIMAVINDMSKEPIVENSDFANDTSMFAGGPRVNAVIADLSEMPDAAMALAAACAIATGPSTLRGLKTLRVKETDRVAALHAELTRLGCTVRVLEEAGDVALHITPLNLSRDTGDVLVETYNDHRMAMGMALIGLRRQGVIINNPACVAKTYPSFWAHLRTLYA